MRWGRNGKKRMRSRTRVGCACVQMERGGDLEGAIVGSSNCRCLCRVDLEIVNICVDPRVDAEALMLCGGGLLPAGSSVYRQAGDSRGGGLDRCTNAHPAHHRIAGRVWGS